MQVQFVSSSVPVSRLEKRIIASLQLAHGKTIQLAATMGGQALTEQDAEEIMIQGVRDYAEEAFPELTLEILPGFGPN